MNSGREYPKPRKRGKRKARPALESKRRASVQKQHVVIIPRDLPEVLVGIACVAAFFAVPCALAVAIRAGLG